jgi:hypothetical protein
MAETPTGAARSAPTIAGLRDASVAGALLFLAGSVAFMGIVTAEVL